jgi:hypothetical protein
MERCTEWGNEIRPENRYCTVCGAFSNSAVPFLLDDEKAAVEKYISSTVSLFKVEKVFWTVGAIFDGVVSVLLLLFSVLIVAVFFNSGLMSSELYKFASPVYEKLLAGGVTFAVLAACLCAILFAVFLFIVMIVSFVQIRKISKCVKTIKQDIEISNKRCLSIGNIILTLVFNFPAFVFALINFIRASADKSFLKKIKKAQSLGIDFD